MATNGRARDLTPDQIKKLRTIKATKGSCYLLATKRIEYQTLRYPLKTGRVSDKLYRKLLKAGII